MHQDELRANNTTEEEPSQELAYTRQIIVAQYAIALQFMDAEPELPREIIKLPKALMQHANLLTNEIWQQWRKMLPSTVLQNLDEFYHVIWPDPMTLHSQIDSSNAQIANLPLGTDGNNGLHNDICVRIWEWADAKCCLPTHIEMPQWFMKRGATAWWLSRHKDNTHK